MSISTISLGSSPTGAGGDTIREAFTKINTSFAGVDGNHVAGGAGFVDVTGAVALDLATSRVFHQTMTGNITGLTFSNLPDELEFAPTWRWVLKINATGGYLLSGTPTVTWVDGASFDDLDLSANATNQVMFWREGATTFAALITNGTTALDPYVLSFATNGTQLVAITRAETLDLSSAGVTNLEADGTAGTGTLSYKKNGGADLALAATAFAAGDVLTVTMASSTTASAVSIPRTIT